MSRAAPVAPRLTPRQVRDEIRARVLDAERDRVVAIYLHGSRAKGTARPRSDWDVAVVVRDRVDDWMVDSLRLAALFYACPFSVDLQVFDRDEFEADRTTPGTLPSIIARTGELLYEHPSQSPRRDGPRLG